MFTILAGHPMCGTTQLLEILKAATLTKCRWMTLSEALDLDVIEKNPKEPWICDAENLSPQDVQDLVDSGLLAKGSARVIIIQGPDQVAIRRTPEAQPLILAWRQKTYPEMLKLLKQHSISHYGIPHIDAEETVVNIASLLELKA